MKKFILTLVGVFGFATMAQATTIDGTYVWTNAETIDFSDFTTNTYITSAVAPNGVQIGTPNGDDITVIADASVSASISNGYTGLQFNGEWTPARDWYVGTRESDTSIIFKFAKPVEAVAGLICIYQAGSFPHTLTEMVMSSLDINGSTIQTNSSPLQTFGADNTGRFLGFDNSHGDIYGFSISSAHKTVLDDFTYQYVTTGPTPVPEPCTMLLLGTGLAGLTTLKRKLTKK